MANSGYSGGKQKNNRGRSLKDKIYLSVVRTLEACFLAVLCFGCCTAMPPRPPAPPGDYFSKYENVDHLLRSTVAILTPGKGTPRCTGNFITPELILTARHCFMQGDPGNSSEIPMEAQRAIAMSYDIPFATWDMYEQVGDQDKNPEIPVARIVYYPIEDAGMAETSPLYDVIILKISSDKYKSKHWLPIIKSLPKLGSKVYAAQMPRGMPWLLVDGRVASYLYDRSKKPFTVHSMLLTISLNHGSSGSAVVTEAGEMVGLASTMDDTGNFARYVPSTIILEVLNKYAESIDPRPVKPTKPPAP